MAHAVHCTPAVLKLVLFAAVVVLAAVVWVTAMGDGPVATEPEPAAPRQAAPAAAGERRIELTEADVTQRMNQRLAGQPLGATPLGPATLTQVNVQLRNGRMEATGDARVATASVPMSMSARGGVENSRAMVKVDELSAAGVPLPASARDSVQQIIQEQVEGEVERSQLRITSVAIDRGRLILTGTPR